LSVPCGEARLLTCRDSARAGRASRSTKGAGDMVGRKAREDACPTGGREFSVFFACSAAIPGFERISY
jgi:hypothetical protein